MGRNRGGPSPARLATIEERLPASQAEVMPEPLNPRPWAFDETGRSGAEDWETGLKARLCHCPIEDHAGPQPCDPFDGLPSSDDNDLGRHFRRPTARLCDRFHLIDQKKVLSRMAQQITEDRLAVLSEERLGAEPIFAKGLTHSERTAKT